MDLKQLMENMVDVAEMCTKLGDISELSAEANEIDQKIIAKENEILELVKDIPRDEEGTLRIDLMNGTVLVIEEDGVLYMEVKGGQ